MNLTKSLMILGLATSMLAVLMKVFGAEKEISANIFAVGFVLVALGIIVGIFRAISEKQQGISLIGLRIAAVGFAIAAIPTAIGGIIFRMTDSELSIFFWPGLILVIVGLIIHAWHILKNKSG